MGRTSQLEFLRAWFPSPGAQERDPGFRRTLESVVQTGMYAAGLLGLVGASMYVLAHFLVGAEFAWWGSGGELARPVLLWDKALIAGIGIGLLAASRLQLNLRSGRLLMSFVLIVAAFALIWEDAQGGDFMFTAAWLALVMFLAVGTVPFQPWQTGVLCGSIIALYATIATSRPVSAGGLSADYDVARLIYLGLVAFLSMIMSAVIYRGRVGQYLSLIELRETLRARFGSEEFAVRPSDVSVMSADERFIDSARQAVERHMDDSSFNVTTLATELNMSPRQLQRKLRALMGQRPTDFVRLIRLQRAAQLLEMHAGSISEIAYSVGFNYPEHFTKCFRELYGMPPSTYADGNEIADAQSI